MENKMVKPDWKLFEFKFSENPQKNFEWFCYLLFCKEFNQSYGIPRLYNQPGIETFPVEYDNEVIGWQAKYFSSKINKDDVLDSVKKAIEKYPKISKLILFSNQEWHPNKYGNYPKGRQEILEFCNSHNLKIEERFTSYFEKIAGDNNYYDITSFFFTNIQESREKILKVIKSQCIQELPHYKDLYEKKIYIKKEDNEIFSKHSVNPLIDFFEEKLLSTKFEEMPNFFLKGVAGIGKSLEMKKTYNTYLEKFSEITVFKKYRYVFIPFFLDLKYFQEDFFSFEDKEGFYLIFLDGLDEISDEKIILLSKAIKKIKANYKFAKFIISGRNASFISDFLANENNVEIFLDTYVDENLTNLIRYYKNSPFESIIQIPFYREFAESESVKQIKTYKQFFQFIVDNRLHTDKNNRDFSENISMRINEKSKINLDSIKQGLTDLASYLHEKQKRSFTEIEIKKYLSADNLTFVLNSTIFDYKSSNEICFVSNIFFEYFYAHSLVNKNFRKVRNVFFNKNGSIRVSNIHILYILLNILSCESKLYKKLEQLLSNFSQAYILLSDFITLPSNVRYEKYTKIIEEYNQKKELIYYGRFNESYDMFANIPSLADKMFELLPDDRQLDATKLHIQIIENFLNSPNENQIRTFSNAVILLGFGEEKRWNKECQKLLKQISIPLLKFFLNDELAKNIKGLLSSLVVFLWYKTYEWTAEWTIHEWKQFILDAGRNTAQDFYSFYDENDYKLKRTFFIRFNNNPEIWKLLVPIVVHSCLLTDKSGHASHVPAVLDDEFKTSVLHFDEDIYNLRYVIQSESQRITVHEIIEIANHVSQKATHRISRDYESRKLVEELSKQYIEKVSYLTNDDIPILYSIIKNVINNNNGLYSHDLIRYINPLSDEIKIAVYAMILEGIKNKKIKSDSYALWQPMTYLLKVKENNEAAITYLKNTKSISFSCYKDIFFFCKRAKDEHPCKEYCIKNYKYEFPEEYKKEIAYSKRRDTYNLKIIEMRKKEINFVLSPEKIILEIDRIFKYLDSDQNPFKNDSERMDLIYLNPEHTLDFYEYGLNKESKDPEVFSEFVLNILRDTSFNDDQAVDREKIKEVILSWGDLKQNFWRFFFWYYVHRNKSEKVNQFMNDYPQIVDKIKESMEVEVPSIFDSQDITIFDGGKNWVQIVPIIYYLKKLYNNKLPSFINPQELLMLVAFPAWCLTEYGVHTTGDYKWGEYESVFDFISILLNVNKIFIIDYAISIYTKLNSDISKTQIVSYLCDSLVNGSLQSEEAISLVLKESINECSNFYKPEENINSMNFVLQNFWNKYEKDVVNRIVKYVDFGTYRHDEKNYCHRAMADYIIKKADSEKKKNIISIIKKNENVNKLSDDKIHLLARLGDEKATIILINQYLAGKSLNTTFYWNGSMFGIEKASNRAFKKIIELFDYSLQKSNDRRQDLHSITVSLINRNVTKKNFKKLKKSLQKIIEYKRANNEYFEYVQNYLNEVEQKVYR